MTLSKHFVTFYSPGTFCPEDTTKPIDSWDVDTALKMADEITERHNAKPFGFRFTTRSREEDELDSKITSTSPMHYFGGEILTLEDIKNRNDPSDETLIWNMEANNIERVFATTKGWKWHTPLKPEDIVLP